MLRFLYQKKWIQLFVRLVKVPTCPGDWWSWRWRHHQVLPSHPSSWGNRWRISGNRWRDVVRTKLSQEKTLNDIPLNTSCLKRDPYLVFYIIILIYLGSTTSPTYPKQPRVFLLLKCLWEHKKIEDVLIVCKLGRLPINFLDVLILRHCWKTISKHILSYHQKKIQTAWLTRIYWGRSNFLLGGGSPSCYQQLPRKTT